MVSGPAGFLFLSSLFLSFFLFPFTVCVQIWAKKRKKERNDQCIARCFLFAFAHPHYKNLPLTKVQLTPLFDPVIVSLCMLSKLTLSFYAYFNKVFGRKEY